MRRALRCLGREYNALSTSWCTWAVPASISWAPTGAIGGVNRAVHFGDALAKQAHIGLHPSALRAAPGLIAALVLVTMFGDVQSGEADGRRSFKLFDKCSG